MLNPKLSKLQKLSCKPLGLYDSVYVVTKGATGITTCQRCFVVRLHDDVVQVLSLDLESIFWINRDNVVSTERAKRILR